MPDRIGELASMEGYSPEEADFQFGVRATPWFGEFAQQHGEPNLNDPNYDYRAAWTAGARPNVRDPGDSQYHWPSQFKGPEHPNRFVNGVDTITGQPVSTGEEYAGLGGDPSHLANTIKNWWTNQPSWLDRAKAENQKTLEAYGRGGMGEIAQQLATDTTEAQELYGAFGVGNIKGIRPPVVPGALAATSEYRPPFYSAVEQAVQGAKQNAAPGQQWAGFLRNQPGVKPEEVEALKLGKLFEQPGSVPKEAVLGEIAANRVNVGEVVKGSPQYSQEMQNFLTAHQNSNIAPRPAPTTPDQWQALSDRLMWMGQNRQPLGDTAGAQRFFSLAEEAGRHAEGVNPLTGSTAGMPKFSQYTLPGGENYREMLLTLPDKGTPSDWKVVPHPTGSGAGFSIKNAKGEYGQNANGTQVAAWNTEREAMEAIKDYAPSQTNKPEFKSSHYDEPNILAHVRYNDRVIDGKKTLFVEEVQSDWHQQGKRQGYKDSDRYEELLNKYRGGRATDADMTELNQLNTAQARGVPDAPFKTTWPELAMKRIIRGAAEKGYDKVAWTPGSVQAERYDLSKQLETLRWTGDHLWGWKKGEGGAPVINQTGVTKDNLADYVGKEAAERMLAAPKIDGRYRELTGLDLKVGGEGMKGFYDEILPATVNKLVKKHGGRVEGGKIVEENPKLTLDTVATDMGFGGWHSNLTAAQKEMVEARWEQRKKFGKETSVHSLEITPSLRAAAMKGFPLFTAGGVAATGIMGELARQDDYRQ